MFPPPPRPRDPDEQPDDRLQPPAPQPADPPPEEPPPAEELAPEDATRRVTRLEARVRGLERKLAASSLHSEKFLTRAFTVLGHYMVAYIIICLPLGILALCCAGLLGGPGGGSGTGRGFPR